MPQLVRLLAQRLHQRMQRRDLSAHVIGHGRAVRLVFGKDVIAKGLAGRVENDRDMARMNLLEQTAQHVDHALDRAGGLAGARH